MNKPIETSTELVVKEQINALELFTGENVDPLLEGIKAKVKSFTPDLSTGVGRKEIASMAHKVAQAKTALDNAGKELVADWKQKAKAVDASRKHIRDSLDYLKAEVRQPLMEWEDAEKKRVEEEKRLAEYLADWDEALAENSLIDRQREIERKEAELARIEEERRQKEEAERLAKEEAERKERKEKERIEREARLQKEAEDKARREEQEKAEREKEELRRKEIEAKLAAEKAERDRIEAEEREKAAAIKAEQDRIEAEQKAERERIEAAERAEREKQEAIEAERKRAQEEADRKERERLEAERIEKERLATIAADKEHRAQINREALADLMNIVDEDTGKAIISAIAKGQVSHISVNY